MRKAIKFLFILLYALLMANCSNDASENTSSFDPDGIAYLNNGDGVDFNQYENVLYFYSDRIDDKKETAGIVNTFWEDSDNAILCFCKDKNPDYRFGKDLEAPFYYYRSKNGNDIYAGTFNLIKSDEKFFLTIAVDKKYDIEKSIWVSYAEEAEKFQYIVSNEYLALID